jgi:hypothetical protein
LGGVVFDAFGRTIAQFYPVADGGGVIQQNEPLKIPTFRGSRRGEEEKRRRGEEEKRRRGEEE